MPEWISYLAGAALKSSALLLVAWMATRLLRRRSAAVRHLIWTGAAAAVLALPFLTAGLPPLALPGADRIAALAPNITFRSDATSTADRQAPGATPGRAAGAATPGWHPDWKLIVVSVWAAGTAIGLMQMLVAAALLGRKRRQARVHPAAAEGFALARTLGVDHPVRFLEGPADSMPMVFGLLRPAIFLPANAAQWTEERRRLVMLHELAHVRRGDVATHLVARTALSLYWWNPLAWTAWREFLKERERAADDLVLLSGARASDYASHLLEVARGMQPAHALVSTAACMARPSQLEGRLLAILDSRLDRKSVARVSAVAAVIAAIVVAAPFAAMRAQDSSASAPPADLDATISTALAQKNHEILEQAATALERLKQYDSARKLLDTALTIREQAAGQNSEEYGLGLARLGDLAHKRHQYADAISFYTRAALAIGDRPPAARPLTSLGIVLYTERKFDEARQSFQRALVADPDHGVMPLIWMALTADRQNGHAAEAESYFRQAVAAAGDDAAEVAIADDFYARFLDQQGRGAEADSVRQQLAIARKTVRERAMSARTSSTSGIYRVGGGVTSPTLLHKIEPQYTEEARAAKYQGTVVLYVEIGPDGRAQNIQVNQGLGLGLDEEAIAAIGQWQFKPGTKDGEPVTVAAQVEINFRLL